MTPAPLCPACGAPMPVLIRCWRCLGRKGKGKLSATKTASSRVNAAKARAVRRAKRGKPPPGDGKAP